MTWVTDHVFVAGGDYVSDYWADFQAQAGVRAVITVAPTRPGAYLDPAPWAALWLPVADEGGYSPAQLFLGATFMAQALAQGHKVLLHGRQGVHRTRPLVAAHLITQGQGVSRAIRAVEQKPWLPPFKGQPAVLEAFAAQWAERQLVAPG